MDQNLEQLQYPIGKFVAPETYTPAYIANQIAILAAFPTALEQAVASLTADQLDTPYRPDGWTIRQVVHHCVDSHINCFIRIKWALTEEEPTIKYYYEDRWALGKDNVEMPIESSIALLKALHYRFEYLLQSLSASELNRTFIHPEHQKSFSIKEIIGTYAWHGKHHLAHIEQLKARMNW